MARNYKIVQPRQKLSVAVLRNLRRCTFTPRLKEGMSRSEANDAMDAAMDAFVKCITRGVPK